MNHLTPDFLKTLVADLSAHGVKYFEMTDAVVKISFFEPMPKLVEIQAGPGRRVDPEDDMLFGGNPPPEFKKPPSKPSREEMRQADPESASWPEDE